MIYFVDIEASSLLPGSYPIEVAWVGEDGHGEGYLLRPEPGWTEWSPESEAVHGIAPALLWDQGLPCGVVARRVAEVLGDGRARVVSGAPGWRRCSRPRTCR